MKKYDLGIFGKDCRVQAVVFDYAVDAITEQFGEGRSVQFTDVNGTQHGISALVIKGYHVTPVKEEEDSNSPGVLFFSKGPTGVTLWTYCSMVEAYMDGIYRLSKVGPDGPGSTWFFQGSGIDWSSNVLSSLYRDLKANSMTLTEK